MNNQDIAKKVIEALGGRENVNSVAHCATRLRVMVKDEGKIKKEVIENLDKVQGAFFNSGQYQIIFGTGTVNKMYDEVVALGLPTSSKEDMKAEAAKQGNWFQRAIRTFGDVFVPIIPVIVATGLFMGLRGLLNALGITLPEDVTIYSQILTDTAFIILPGLVVWSTFRVFGGNPAVGIVLGMMLVSGSLPNAWAVAQGGEVTAMNFFGFIPVVGLQGSVLPAFIIGVVGAKFEKALRKVVPDVFYAELIDKLEHQLFKNGYKTIICNSEHDSEKEREYIEMLEANQVDGIISGSHNLGIEDYNRVTAPIISFDRNLSPDIPVVSSDNYGGGVLAAQTLVKTGAQSIIMITGNDNSNSPTGLRHAGFASVLPKAPIINVSSDFSPVRKEMEIKNILTHQKPDAIFASDDLTAILVIKIAQELGISVPDELKVIGYDGTYFIENYYPHLTTIKQPMKEIAQLTVDLLLQKIEGKEVATTGYFLPVTLLPGKSI